LFNPKTFLYLSLCFCNSDIFTSISLINLSIVSGLIFLPCNSCFVSKVVLPSGVATVSSVDVLPSKPLNTSAKVACLFIRVVKPFVGSVAQLIKS